MRGYDLFDTARGYSDSEEKLGLAFEGMREKIFIATKTGAQNTGRFEGSGDIPIFIKDRLHRHFINSIIRMSATTRRWNSMSVCWRPKTGQNQTYRHNKSQTESGGRDHRVRPV